MSCLPLILALTSCAPSEASRRITLMFGPMNYMPSRSMVISEANKFPRHNVRLLADEWQAIQRRTRGLDTDVRMVNAPGDQDDYIMWMNLQHAGGMAPDVFFFWPGNESFRRKGWIRPIDKYLEQPNPYVPGNNAWRDVFLAPLLDPQWQHRDGHWYHISVDYFETILYYNRQAFKEAGITNPQPKSWAEFDRMMDRLRRAGYIPFYGDAMWSWWPHGLMCDMLLRKRAMPLVDVLRHDGFVDEEEQARAYSKGILDFRTPEMREYFRLMKEWSRHWPKNWNSANAMRLFIRGKQAIHWTSAWNIMAIKRDPERKFEFGTIYFPPLTRETTRYASNPPVQPGSVGSPGTAFFLNNSPRMDETFRTRDGSSVSREQLAIDWLMYLSSPNANARLTLEKTAMQMCPGVKGVAVPHEMEVLYDVIARGPVKRVFPWGPSVEAGANHDRIFQLYLLGQPGYDLDSALDQMQRWFEKGLEEVIRENQEGPPQDRWDMNRW